SLELGKAERKDDWDGHVHPQGWPVVWIVPRFHTHMTILLQQIIDECISQKPLHHDQLEAVWRIVQPVDPDRCFYRLLPKPLGIPPLIVDDTEEWLRPPGSIPRVRIIQPPSEEWTILFDHYRLSQDEPYKVPYRSQTSVRSTL